MPPSHAPTGLRVAETLMATADFDGSIHFWCELLGLERLAEARGVDAGTAQLWRVDPALIGRRALLGLPGGISAVHLVELTRPGSPVRADVGPLDALPKTLNLLVRDLPAVWQALSARGVKMKTRWVEYQHAGDTYRDAHVYGPDNSNVGLLEVVGGDYPVNRHGVGQPASFTFTVEEMAAEQTFYRRLGGDLRLDRHFDGPAIEALVGLPPGGSLDMKLYGVEPPFGRLELVSYGIPMQSHYERAAMPATGALMVHLEGVDTAAFEALHPGVEPITAAPWGEARPMAALTAPSGARVTLGL